MKRLFSNKPFSTLSHTFYLLLFTFYLSPLTAQETGYRIEVGIDAYESEQVYLGFRRADKVYSKDTTAIADGKYVFEGEEALPPGIYLILMPPDNKFLEFVVTKEEQHFSFTTKAPSFYKNMKFNGSEENRLLHDYQSFMNEQVALSRKIEAQIKNEKDENKKKKLTIQKAIVSKGVKAHQTKTVNDHPGTYVSKLVAAFQKPEIPEAPVNADGTSDEHFAFKYYKAHYWDGFDLSDEIFVNTPYLKQKIDRYLDKLTIQTPDSMIVAVNYILEKAAQNDKVFRYSLPYLLNKFYKPTIMGMDEVYVHISDKYYKSGKADWASKESLKKITDDAFMIRGVLVGKQAPDIKVQLFDHSIEQFTTNLISPYDVDAEFTIVFLWKPGCGHCKAMTAELIPFYEEWKDKGVEIFSISSANHMDAENAIKDIKDKGMPWIVTADLFTRARAMQNYYGISLPKLYVLDKNKIIIANRVGVPQLPDIINDYRKNEESEK